MNKRERMLSLLEQERTTDYVPAAFFLHFEPRYHSGQAAVDKHLEYFRHTGMDFVKIQYERAFPQRPEIARPADWKRMPCYGEAFYEGQLAAVEGLVQAAKREALVLVTLYSPFMCAGQTTSNATITAHLQEDPEAVRPGLEAIAESLLIFVRACIRLGVDGFYASTQGGEAERFADPAIFERYIRPYDLAIMDEINRECPFNILHVCDYHGGYDTLAPWRDYPGDVVNASLRVGEQEMIPRELAEFFQRPFMGGLDRKGVLVSGTDAEVRARVSEVLREAPERFVLAADCTVPSDTDWDRLRMVIEMAHGARAG
jgi:uroporphyrinogen decarboxylase